MSRHIARITTIVTLLATLFLIPITGSAQSNNTESPYSRFGLGRLDKQTPHALRGMGGLTTAIRDNMIINPANPASYTAVDSMTFLFDFGLSMGMNMLTEAGKRDTRMVGNFDYATALIPLGKHFAASAGLVPYSTVGYRYGTKVPVPGVQDHFAAHAYKGQGNLQEVYLGFAWKVLPYWSLGVNTSYLFGNIQHERRITYDVKESQNPTFLDHLRIRSVGVRIGTQGIIPISDDGQQINIGFTYEPKLPMWSRQLSLQTETVTGKGAQVIQTDTITSKSLFARPHVFSAGLAYQIKNKLIAGADVKYSRWGEALATNQSSDYQGVDQWQVALGMSWIPNERSSRYGQRIAYRAGLQGENAYLRIPNSLGGHNSYYQIGANLGLGLPLVDRRSHVDVTLGYSYLLPSSRTGLAEHYLTLGVALRFNEAWFNPIKLD